MDSPKFRKCSLCKTAVEYIDFYYSYKCYNCGLEIEVSKWPYVVLNEPLERVLLEHLRESMHSPKLCYEDRIILLIFMKKDLEYYKLDKKYPILIDYIDNCMKQCEIILDNMDNN